ncbi:hypothetical protein [Rhizosphaericola mali]|uniref:DUF3300 domain-containing protein n=1 Tax=Rhizosphaericola mali TaxID=2545455 RepID=A0A5P2G4I8_9BACT|nr:hypothetical protein [Rhizosphaericola mali]QES90435.1 hypothetical protein E0W69_017830 [Rhizosphaericola mali]
MKKSILFAAIFALGFAVKSNAQVSVSINIGNQPAWAPVGNVSTPFYFIPEMNVYFDVARAMYIYPNGNQWVYVRNLPSRYRQYNMYNVYKVPVNRGGKPYLMNTRDRANYGKYASYHGRQQPIRPNNNFVHGGPGRNNNGHGNNGHDRGNGHGRH